VPGRNRGVQSAACGPVHCSCARIATTTHHGSCVALNTADCGLCAGAGKAPKPYSHPEGILKVCEAGSPTHQLQCIIACIAGANSQLPLVQQHAQQTRLTAAVGNHALRHMVPDPCLLVNPCLACRRTGSSSSGSAGRLWLWSWSTGGAPGTGSAGCTPAVAPCSTGLCTTA
jgi:hypothetical protein